MYLYHGIWWGQGYKIQIDKLCKILADKLGFCEITQDWKCEVYILSHYLDIITENFILSDPV